MAWDANPQSVDGGSVGRCYGPTRSSIDRVAGATGTARWSEFLTQKWHEDGRFLEVYPSKWLVNWVNAEDTFIRQTWVIALASHTTCTYKILSL